MSHNSCRSNQYSQHFSRLSSARVQMNLSKQFLPVLISDSWTINLFVKRPQTDKKIKRRPKRKKCWWPPTRMIVILNFGNSNAQIFTRRWLRLSTGGEAQIFQKTISVELVTADGIFVSFLSYGQRSPA